MVFVMGEGAVMERGLMFGKLDEPPRQDKGRSCIARLAIQDQVL